ncbi:hypothetical protein [Aquabacterium sp.]|uniref:hypothetical protein n=1 Tax=Aquabacterium sp. TaxID=1872578 RepID=UPI0019B9377E|nr:hypothetical protein [Aquabacterium sp.]MBC7700021.1 hypothetical protein [Aquabacterium sp.]
MIARNQPLKLKGAPDKLFVPLHDFAESMLGEDKPRSELEIHKYVDQAVQSYLPGPGKHKSAD